MDESTLTPPFAPTVPAMLEWMAQTYGADEAQVSGAARLTFEELDRRSRQMAAGLLKYGVGKGARVALLMPNGPLFTVAFMAAARLGAVVAPLSTLCKARELAWVLAHGDFHLLLAVDRHLSHDYLDRLEEALPELPRQSTGALELTDAPYLRAILVWGDRDRQWAINGSEALSIEGAAAASGEAVVRAIERHVVPADPLCMIFTSGSTSDPKCVVHRHGVMLRHSWQKAFGYWPIGDGDRVIGPRPQFWVAGLAPSLFQSLLAGCCLIEPANVGAAEVLRLLQIEGVTAACGDGFWLQTLAVDPQLRAAGYKIIQHSLETALFARMDDQGRATYLNPMRAEREPDPQEIPRDLLPRSYGMTETLSAHTSLPLGEYLPPDKRGCCGRPMPGVRLAIVDPQTLRPLGPGEVGEIMVGGYSLMEGLYKRERREVFTDDDLYATGDLGSIDEDGFLRFHSRIADILKVSGANVSPLEVETRLNLIAQIERSAVVGLPATERDVRLVAAVQLRPGQAISEGQILAHLRTELSSYKLPKRVFFFAADEWPLTGSNKIHKPGLIEPLARRVGAEAAAALAATT